MCPKSSIALDLQHLRQITHLIHAFLRLILLKVYTLNKLKKAPKGHTKRQNQRYIKKEVNKIKKIYTLKKPLLKTPKFHIVLKGSISAKISAFSKEK
jgi:hypothetical protein